MTSESGLPDDSDSADSDSTDSDSTDSDSADSDSTATDRPSLDPLSTLFWGFVALHLALVAAVPNVPAQDMPAHLASSAVLGQLLFGDPSPIVDSYFQLAPSVTPTWGAHLILSALHVVLSPFWVEKLSLCLYVLALPLAARSLLRAASCETWRALLFLPLLLSYPFHTGLLSYCFSLPLLLWLLALWTPADRASGAGTRWVLRSAVLATLLVIAHPVSWGIAALALSCAIVHQAVRWGGWASARRGLVRLVVTFAPGAVVVAGFTAGQGGAWERWPWAVVWRSLLTLNSLVSFDRHEIYWTSAWGAVLVAVATWALVARRRADVGSTSDGTEGGADEALPVGRFDGWLWAAGATLMLYLVAPDAASGGSLILPRLELSIWLLLTSWLVLQPWTRSIRFAALVCAAGLSFGLLSLHAASYVRFQSVYAEFDEAATHLEPGRTLLPLIFSSRGAGPDGERLSIKVRPFASIGSKLALDRGLVDLNNYQAATGYFPIVFRPEIDPAVKLWRDTQSGRQLDLAGYHRDTRGTVDYVLLYGYRPGRHLANRKVSHMAADLASAYEPVYRSPSGELLLFARRRSPPSNTQTQADQIGAEP